MIPNQITPSPSFLSKDKSWKWISHSLILLFLLSSFSKASALQIDENSPFYDATYFNGLWDATNWDTKFGNADGTDGPFAWNTTTKTLTISDDILIKRSSSGTAPRIELTISGNNGFDIIMSGGSGVSRKIEVDEGEYLMLTDGLIITSSQPYWEGIKAFGKSSVSQFDLGSANNIPEYHEAYNGTTTYNNAQSMVVMDGGSKILNALTAMHSVNGAILIAANSTIEHCRVGVKIENYTHPTDPIKENLEYRNASYLSHATILINNLIDGAADYSGYYGVWLNNVHGIHIQGSLLQNVNGENFPLLSCSSLGYGIYSFNSSFSMHKSGTPMFDEVSGCVDYNGSTCKVTRFSHGIYAMESSTVPTVRPKLAIQENFIENNLSGITVIGGTDYAFKDNTISLETSPNWPVSCPCSFEPKGISLTNVRSFGIVNNYIFAVWGMKSKDSPQSQMDFIEIDNGGSAKNKIQNNLLMGASLTMTKTGVRIIGMNDQLEPWCANRIERMDNGILVESGATPNQTWGRANGSGMGNVGNTYASNITDLVNNSSISIDYYEAFSVFSNYTISGTWNQKNPDFESTCEPLNCLFWTPLSTQKAPLPASIHLYPNPLNGGSKLFLQSETELSGEIIIRDISGKQVRIMTISDQNEIEIDISYLKKGTYFLQINQGGSPISKVFIIN